MWSTGGKILRAKMASDETMYGSDDENSLAFSQLHTPFSQNPSKSPLDVSCASKINLLFYLSLFHNVHAPCGVLLSYFYTDVCYFRKTGKNCFDQLYVP